MAEHYGTLADALAYHQERGNAAWASTGDHEAKQSALLRGSVWVDNTYRYRFSGKKTGGRSQEREWPRTDAEDAAGEEIAPDEVPTEIDEAAYEAALRELVKPGSLAPDFDGSKIVKSERKKIGQIEKEMEYAEATAKSSLPVFALIDGILATLLAQASGTTSVCFVARV
ncbi:hypothetical protein GHJ84_29665 [Sinorhizobium meliloti]|uniref:DnaT-like ssDNA-binding protein n=1 Tax=Rhizobium meliloti TaxID=382 RepID=UPI001295DACE|nr:DnaT-like ssDNA-binding protein [Sinorhizobium meliloti]MQX25032.1 hypothetical protein [Sinorhizobium meliloti]